MVTGTTGGYEHWITRTFGSSRTSGSVVFMYRGNTNPAAAARMAALRDSSDNQIIYLMARTDGNVRIYHGSTACTTTGLTINDGTARYFWIDYALGSGSDGTASLYIGTSTTKPGTAVCSITTGTATTSAPAAKISLGGECPYDQTTQWYRYFDRVLTDNSTITGTLCD
jgi:hypothetical protein